MAVLIVIAIFLLQQTLYCHVHDNMTRVNGVPTARSNFLGNGDSATLKLDRIMVSYLIPFLHV